MFHMKHRGGIDARPVAIWLFACCGMVFVAALIGAVTRLTGSGLSITDWNPIMGVMPPLDAAAWGKAFAAYKQIPQYEVLNRGMTLTEFKGIYFWEWMHRLWDRLIGVVFALPFLWFLARGRITRRAAWGFAGIFALGALQGFIGWYMVESGLELRTSVSPYRLALHLGGAIVIYAIMLWTGLGLYHEGAAKAKIPSGVFWHGWLALGLLAVTMTWGAFVAGLHAGEAYNTWPLMEGQVLPDAAWTLNPAWINAFENLALVQFIHRWLGPATMLVILGWIWRCWQAADASNRSWLKLLGGMALLQVALGISTLLAHAEIALAVLHQAGAITLLTLLLINLQRVSSSGRRTG
jgi:cytochrome c oxidase assembly protein subunit 15